MTFIAKRVGGLVGLLFLSVGGGCCADSAFQTARQFQAEGNYPAAERFYREFLREEPRSVPALANLGIVLAHQGKFGDAVNVYRTALSIDPGALPVKLDLALAYYRMNDWTEAIAAFQAVLDVDSKDRRSLQLLAISYSQAGQFSQAAATYEKLLPSGDPAVLIGLATAYRELGRMQDSESVLRSALTQHPDAPEVRFLLGLAQYARGDLEQARSSFEQSIRFDDKADARFYLGATYFKERKFQDAIQYWKSAVRIDPQYFSATFALGSLLSELGRYDDAKPYLEAALHMRPGDALTQLEMARWCLLNGQFTRAAGLLEGATRANPKAKQASFLLAKTYQKLGWTERASAEFARSRDLYNSSVDEDALSQVTTVSQRSHRELK